MDLPLNINPCPIIDANFEIRFQSRIYSSAVFGVIYNTLRTDFPKVEKLPILQIPEELREIDPNLKNKPYYKAEGGGYIIQIGPNVFNLSPQMPYPGWSSFSSKIFDCLEKIFKLNIFETVNRFGIRYINFFDINIFDNIKLSIELNDSRIDMRNTHFRTQILENGFINTLQVSNNVFHNKTAGSLIDIDTYKEYTDGMFFDSYQDEIVNGHSQEKILFFSLLRPEFLDSLNPKYNEANAI